MTFDLAIVIAVTSGSEFKASDELQKFFNMLKKHSPLEQPMTETYTMKNLFKAINSSYL